MNFLREAIGSDPVTVIEFCVFKAGIFVVSAVALYRFFTQEVRRR